jgi:nondiscriminating glutamyl-tRNA synthetase
LDDTQFAVDSTAREVLSWDLTKTVLNKWLELVKGHQGEEFTPDEFIKIQDEVKNATGAKSKNLFQPIRVAVIGKPQGTELKALIPLIKKSSLIVRAEKTIQSL